MHTPLDSNLQLHEDSWRDACEEDRLIFSDQVSEVVLCPANYDRDNVVGYSIIAAGTNADFEFLSDGDWDFENQGIRATFDTIPRSKHIILYASQFLNSKKKEI